MTSQFVSCPDCHVLVLDTNEERREHRAADRQNRQVIEAIRRTVRSATDDSSKALQLVRDLQRDLEQIDGRVRTAEDAPEPEIVVGTWPEDELDEPDQETQYADEDTDPGQPDPVEPDPVDDDEEDFDDDEPPQAIVNASSDPLRTYFAPTT